MKAEIGDKIVFEAEKVGQPARAGVVEEVLDDNQPRLRIRWDDGHTSIVTPTAGVAHIEGHD